MLVYRRANTIWSKLNLKPFPSRRKLWMSGSSWDQRMRPVRIFETRKWPRHGRDAGNNFGGWINERSCEGSDLELEGIHSWTLHKKKTQFEATTKVLNHVEHLFVIGKLHFFLLVFCISSTTLCPDCFGTSLYISFNLPPKKIQSIFATKMAGGGVIVSIRLFLLHPWIFLSSFFGS